MIDEEQLKNLEAAVKYGLKENVDVSISPGGVQKIIDELRSTTAATSEMLEALKKCEVVMTKNVYPMPDRGPDHPWSILKKAREVIAKAEGKEKEDE